MRTLDRLAQSPNLNAIEHICYLVDRRLRKLPELSISRKDLWEKIQDVWNDIKVEDCTNLIDTMPRRIKAAMKAHGGYTAVVGMKG